eukprot:ctg_4110.g733
MVDRPDGKGDDDDDDDDDDDASLTDGDDVVDAESEAPAIHPVE